MIKITWTVRQNYTTHACVGNRSYGIIRHPYDGNPSYSAYYFEWDEDKWPKELFESGELGVIEAIFMRGDAYEVHLGDFKAKYQAKKTLEKHIKQKVK